GVAGDAAAAEAAMAAARAPVLEDGDSWTMRRYYTNSVYAFHYLGRYEDAVAIGFEGIEMHSRAGLNREGKMCLQENVAESLCELGRPAAAIELIGDERGAFGSDSFGVLASLAKASLMCGDLDTALQRVD